MIVKKAVGYIHFKDGSKELVDVSEFEIDYDSLDKPPWTRVNWISYSLSEGHIRVIKGDVIKRLDITFHK